LDGPPVGSAVPTVEFRGRSVDCERGAVLREVLLAAGESPHNGRADALNCRGNGTCGTCAVRLRAPEGGDPPVSARTRVERARLRVPPHDPDAGLRLACQVRVEGDLVVEKGDGFWGESFHGAADAGSGAGEGDRAGDAEGGADGE